MNNKIYSNMLRNLTPEELKPKLNDPKIKSQLLSTAMEILQNLERDHESEANISSFIEKCKQTFSDDDSIMKEIETALGKKEKNPFEEEVTDLRDRVSKADPANMTKEKFQQLIKDYQGITQRYPGQLMPELELELQKKVEARYRELWKEALKEPIDINKLQALAKEMKGFRRTRLIQKETIIDFAQQLNDTINPRQRYSTDDLPLLRDAWDTWLFLREAIPEKHFSGEYKMQDLASDMTNRIHQLEQEKWNKLKKLLP